MAANVTHAESIAARLEARRERARLSALEALLEDDVRRHLRTADAKLELLDFSNRRIRTEAELD
jgi:hypothetical protein